MAKKTLPIVCQVTPSSSQIAVDEMIIFFGSMPNICIFFQLPKLNKYCLGAELAPAHKVIKSSIWIICGSARCIPLHAATATECYKKTKRVRQLLKF